VRGGACGGGYGGGGVSVSGGEGGGASVRAHVCVCKHVCVCVYVSFLPHVIAVHNTVDNVCVGAQRHTTKVMSPRQ
jgi:hypothetical protein